MIFRKKKRTKPRKWVVGRLVVTGGGLPFSFDPKFITPKEVGDGKSPHFEKCIHWILWHFYKVRTCDRCGKLACGKGMIRYFNDSRTKTLAYFCPECAKRIPALKKKAKRYCSGCERECIL